MKLKRILLIVIPTLFLFFQDVLAYSVLEDTIKALSVRVEFQEDDSPNTTGNGKFDLSQSTNVNQIDPPPHNRSYFQDHLEFVKNYFLRISRDGLLMTGEVFPESENLAYQLDHPMTFYNPNTTPNEINQGLATLFRDAILKADDDPNINFSLYQSFVVFHAGVGKDVNLGYDETPQDIPSLFITSDFLQEYLGIEGIPVDGGAFLVREGMILPETESQDGIELGLNGVVTSNFGTQLGWLDLFSPEEGRTGIGRFGLMDPPGFFNADGLLPASPCAWTRQDAGLEIPITIYYSSEEEFTIYSTLSDNPNRVYRIPINESEYFLIENRYSGSLNFDSLQYVMGENRGERPTAREVLRTHFSDQVTFSSRGVLIDVENPDIGLPGTGCLIWHIDENIIEQNRSENTINNNPKHRGVDVEEADGSQDIGQLYDYFSPGVGSENGWILDLWYDGNNSPIFKNEFSANTFPNSRSYYNRANSHIKIYDFSTPDSIMTFRIKLDIYQQNFPQHINPVIYGNATSIKTTDLDFDDREDLIITTDQGKILALNFQGYSVWGSDSFLVADLGHTIIPPLVLFDNPYSIAGQSKGLVGLTESGTLFGFSFQEDHTIDTLIQPIILSTPTTPPIAIVEDNFPIGIYWGSANGDIYKLDISQSGVEFDTLFNIGEPVEFLHINVNSEVIVLSQTGNVYVNGEWRKQSELPYFRPVGDMAVGLTRDGKFLNFEEDEGTVAEEGLYRFDSPMITNPVSYDDISEYKYFVLGNNKVFQYNYNFTLSDNYPLLVYSPDREVYLPLTPLFNTFFNNGLQEVPGVITIDPAGLIDGFDMTGKRLVDFPLAVGDSILTTPVICDIDNDSDLEIAAITKNGNLYVWDFSSSYFAEGWNQLYGDEMNSNRSLDPGIFPPPEGSDIVDPNQLLPKNKVFNWPNPNEENFTFIRYFLTASAKVNIKIYDMAGDLVDEFTGPGDPQTDNEVRWNLSDIQSGVYFARIEAQSLDKKEFQIIKIAVIK